MMQHIHNLLHTQGAAIQKISSAHNIKGDSLLYPKSASVEDFTYVDYKKRFSQSISEIPTICTHRVGFGKSWRKRRLMKRDPNKLGTRKMCKWLNDIGAVLERIYREENDGKEAHWALTLMRMAKKSSHQRDYGVIHIRQVAS